MKTITGLTEDERKGIVNLLETANTKTITTIKDIRQIDRICTLVEASDGNLDLEDADYEYMKKRINDFSSWVPQLRKEIITLADKLGL
jgi:hypothetical protein